MRITGLASLSIVLFVAAGCGDDDGDDGGSGASGGSGGGSINVGGTAGKTSGSGGTSKGGSGNTTGDGGDGSGNTTGDGGDGSGAQPSGSGGEPSGGSVQLGGLCAVSDNCSQAEGEAVCCQAESCTAPCECTPASECPSNPSFLPCESSSECEQFGGGRVCCDGGVMTYCTKPSGCLGEPLP